jgi:hypothetical protein
MNLIKGGKRNVGRSLPSLFFSHNRISILTLVPAGSTDTFFFAFAARAFAIFGS